jgi:hypothetical protein
MELTGVSIFIFSIAFLIFYIARMPIYIGVLDPIKIQAIQEAVWTTTFFQLFESGYISIDYATLIILTLTIWLFGWFITCKYYGKKYKEFASDSWNKLCLIDRSKTTAIYIIFYFSITLYCAYTYYTSGGGDARLLTNKTLRLIEGPVYLLSAFVIFRMLISKNRASKLVLAITMIGLVYIGGKSAAFAILLPITAAVYIKKIRLGIASYTYILLATSCMLVASIFINYSSQDILNSLINRILMEGDIYIYSFILDGITFAKVESIFLYVFSPILKTSFFPFNYDVNVGAQISSGLAGTDLYTGPNAHWPIVLIGAKIYSIFQIIIFSIAFYLLLIFLKFHFISVKIFKINPIYLAPLVSYTAQYPQTGFADPNIALIFLVHLFYTCVLLFVISNLVKKNALN